MNCKRTFRQLALALAVAAAMASPSFAATYNLTAGTATITVAGQSVPVWGFACVSTDVAGAACVNAVTVPGPMLVVPPGEDLIINLSNNLPEPVSIIIPGQALPAVTGGIAQGVVTDLQGRQRITSFTGQAAAGFSATFTWTGLQPGTYLYQSGSHVTQQVQMGLYGALTKDAAAGQAYPGVSYDAQVILLYSEIDRALHDPVAIPANAINYNPTYFLVNGQPFTAGALPVAAVTSDQRVLLRFLNAGLKTHVPALKGAYMSVVAEDGKPYPYAREQYSVMLAAGKTQDAIFNPTEGTFAVWDRSLHLSNAGAAGGGMFSTIQVGAGGAPVAVADAYPATEDTTLDTTASSLNGVLFNDTGSPTTASLVDGTTAGALTLNADGSFTYIPNANFNGTDSFTYRAFAGTVGSNPATVTITVAAVNDTPVAAADAYATDQGVLLTVAAPGVLGNDSDVDGNPLTAVKLTNPASGTLTWPLSNDGSFTYTNATAGIYTFTYAANDGTVNSLPATVTITVNPHVDRAPVAVDDFNTTRTTTPVNINVLGNDYDLDLPSTPPLPITGRTVTIVSKPNRGGTITVNASTGVVTYTAKKNFRGTDTFSYRVIDNVLGATSNVAFVRINVVR